MKIARGEGHKFFCIKCGKESIPLFRKSQLCKEKFHRKRLWCPWCKQEINCIEVRNDQEKQEFLDLFQGGFFAEEAQECVEFIAQEAKL